MKLLLEGTACLMLAGIPGGTTSGQSCVQTGAPTNYWSSVVCSADGSRIIAVGSQYPATFGSWSAGPVYISTNSGTSWTTNGSGSGAVVTSSADGVTLVTVASETPIWSSTNSGSDWLSTWFSPESWDSLASSGDGSTIFLASDSYGPNPSLIYVSTNFGLNWTSTGSPYKYWRTVACSADGTKVIAASSAADEPGGVYTSQDSGNTWTESNLPIEYWLAVNCSADGTTMMAAGAFDGDLYISTDSGMNWVLRTPPGQSLGSPLACSADGTMLAAVGGSIFTSIDVGATWKSNTVPALSWTSIASSADGHKLVAAAYGGGIYTLQSTPAPKLNITRSGNQQVISWTVPSRNFVLQTTVNLKAPQWSEVAVSPVLDYARLQYQITIPMPTGTTFYRLAQE